MERLIKKLFGPRAKEIQIKGKRSKRVIIRLKEDPENLGNWFLGEIWKLKNHLTPSGKVQLVLKRVPVPGLGTVNMELTYPHSTSVKISPPGLWPYPHYPVNSPSEHETRGKYRLILEEKPDRFQDNIVVKVGLRSNGTRTTHQTDVDLLMEKNGEYILSEIINGRTQDPLAAVRRKSEVWRVLTELGYPVGKLILYVIPKSQSHFEGFKLPEITEILRSAGFTGKVIITRPFGIPEKVRKF